MNIKVFFLQCMFFSIFKSYEIPDNQVYNLCCDEFSYECTVVHALCEEVGKSLFDIWFQLDLFFSMYIEYDNCQKIYNDICRKIQYVKNILHNFLCNKTFSITKKHKNDLENIMKQIMLINQHQIIKYTDFLNKECEKCKILALMLCC